MPQREFDDTNRGVLWNNQDRKREGKQDPDYGGKLNVEGTAYWINGWIKTSRKGNKFLSLSVKAVESRRSAGNGASARDDDTDGLAF